MTYEEFEHILNNALCNAMVNGRLGTDESLKHMEHFRDEVLKEWDRLNDIVQRIGITDDQNEI